MTVKKAKKGHRAMGKEYDFTNETRDDRCLELIPILTIPPGAISELVRTFVRHLNLLADLDDEKLQTENERKVLGKRLDLVGPLGELLSLVLRHNLGKVHDYFVFASEYLLSKAKASIGIYDTEAGRKVWRAIVDAGCVDLSTSEGEQLLCSAITADQQEVVEELPKELRSGGKDS